jgi:hypothetical protein
MKKQEWEPFTAEQATEIAMGHTEEGVSKGQVIDGLRTAAKEGYFGVNAEGIPEHIVKDLVDNHGFTYLEEKNAITWPNPKKETIEEQIEAAAEAVEEILENQTELEGTGNTEEDVDTVLEVTEDKEEEKKITAENVAPGGAGDPV